MSIHNDASITRKRTREDADEVSELDERPFVIKDPSDPFARPRSLTPICLLSRAQLPLAYLDTTTSGSRIFSARVRVLESSHEHGDDSTVLIAKELSGSKLLAVERVERRCYALCRLGGWVTESAVKARARVILRREDSQVKRRALDSGNSAVPWWRSAAVEAPTAPKHAISDGPDLPVLAMRRVMEAPQKTSISADTATHQDTAPATMDDQALPDVPMTESHASPWDTLKELSRQYLDALYLSRTSLAYFTKGPLSRARAAFTMPDSSNDVHELIQFLRDCTLTSSTMDKKYKDGVPAVVKELPISTFQSPEKTPSKPMRKKRRKWKPKRDKDGFFVDEHEYMERWWEPVDEKHTVSSSAENVEDTIRRRVARVRNRETFLQIIIILEVLALELAHPGPIEPVSTDHGRLNGEKGNPEVPTLTETKKVKSKKKQDLPALLETLLDKLCIWQSLQSHSPDKRSVEAKVNISDVQGDELQSFCVEVVMPFFSSRIQHYAMAVNKKLGGPTAPSPIKRKSSTSRKPGEPAVRQPPEKKVRQPLARVSTETWNQYRDSASDRPPSLQRSVTDSDAAFHIKREGSEIPMDSIPFAQPLKQVNSRRSSLFTREAPQLKAFSKREVDLTAMSASNEAKMRKKKDVEAKLKEAVEMLKKPNRALAVKEVEERTDQTFAKALSRSKSSHKMSISKMSTGAPENAGARRSVNISSTPKHVRTVKATPHKPSGMTRTANANIGAYAAASTAQFDDDQPFALPTSTPAIPQTGHRPRVTQNIQQTPSRGFAKFMPAGLARQPGTLESPVSCRMQAIIQQTPSKQSLRQPVEPLAVASPNVAKAAEASGGADSADEDRSGKTNSIYDALGWDDDGYEELT